MSELYPLKFQPIFKEKIWGGTKIRDLLGKDIGDLENCGESWEISGVDGNVSVVSEGELKGENLKSLIIRYKEKLLGKHVFESFGEEFPLLIKFIDANDDLSIQVHPDDELAMKKHNSFGKTEMWYILQADQNSQLISGFNQPMSRDLYLEYFNSGNLIEVLNKEKVEKGDVFFLPAGRVHTIGKGLLLAEIQQTSDITYRIYDFDRIDKEGNKRELHTEEALEALDFEYYGEYKTVAINRRNELSEVVHSRYFSSDLLNLEGKISRDYEAYDSFVILIGIEGTLTIETSSGIYSLNQGETILIPASVNKVELSSIDGAKILETHAPYQKQ